MFGAYRAYVKTRTFQPSSWRWSFYLQWKHTRRYISGVKEQNTETATLGVQVMGILPGLRGLGRDVDQTSRTPSGQLLFTDQLPTETPCGSKMICRSRMFYPKCFPTPLLGAGSLTDTSFVNCMCPPQAF